MNPKKAFLFAITLGLSYPTEAREIHLERSPVKEIRSGREVSVFNEQLGRRVVLHCHNGTFFKNAFVPRLGRPSYQALEVGSTYLDIRSYLLVVCKKD